MKIANKEEYKQITITELGLSVRAYNCLHRAGYETLYLVIENYDKLPSLRNMGERTLNEIDARISEIASGEGSPSDDLPDIKEALPAIPALPESILNRPLADLNIPKRAFNALSNSGIKTIGEAVLLTDSDLLALNNLGQTSAAQIREQLDLLVEQGKDYFQTAALNEAAPPSAVEPDDRRELDSSTVRKLLDDYGLKSSLLCDWFGVSKQRIQQKLTRRRHRGCWLNRDLMDGDRSMIEFMVNSRSFFFEENGKRCYLFNNRKDDCAFVLVSDEKIKCFFLKDLPEEIKSTVVQRKLELLSEAEISSADTGGKTVYILKEPYFLPDDPNAFGKLAAARGLSAGEYSKFLHGMPLCSRNVAITDDRIIACLEKYTINGITSIPATSDTHWLRTYISRSPYSTEEFIAFYGFSTTDSSPVIDGSDGVEQDMRVFDSSGDPIANIFAASPLLGSFIMPREMLEAVNNNSRDHVVRFLKGSSKELDLKAEMEITLAVINYAKNWNSEDESGFWRFITAQFGFHDENGKLRSFLCSCINDSLISNGRWFVVNSSGNQFKSSIMVHAFSTRRSWLCFCDLLFDFYKTNLNWEYIEGDPMIARMVSALRSRMLDSDDTAEDIRIGSNIYGFREGQIKLITLRPKYAEKLAETMIRRIDAIINGTARPAALYEEQLCDEWLANKLRSLSETKRNVSSGEHRAVAIDYTRIAPVYRLRNETDVKLVFPDVRLAESAFSALTLTVYCGDRIVESSTLGYYGNELGRTMKGFDLDIHDYLRRTGSNAIDPRVVIACDSKEIYNSDKTLYRECLVFRGKNEIDIGSCEQDSFSVFAPGSTKVDFINANLSVIREDQFLRGWYAVLQKGFVVNINGNPAAFDDSQDNGLLRIVAPGSAESAGYLENGIRYTVAAGEETIHIISVGSGSSKRYRIAVNSDFIDLDSLPCESSQGTKVYKLVLGSLGLEQFSLRISDLADNRALFSRNYKLINGFSVAFNRQFYYSADDYNEAKLTLSTHLGVKQYPLTPFESRIKVPFASGELEISVPTLKVIDNASTAWDGSNLYWIKDIPQDRFLYAKAPAGLSTEMRLGGRSIGTESSGAFALGNAVSGYDVHAEDDRLEVRLSVLRYGKELQSYVVGSVAVKEQFAEEPVIRYTDGSLSWNRGRGFIGNMSGSMKLTVRNDHGYQRTFELNLKEELISDGLELPLGEYCYTIEKISSNLFSMASVSLAEGTFFVGDENELRFLNCTIQINEITFEDDSKYDSVRIRPSFIDHIEYKGIRYVRSEEMECPIYTGIMFFINDSGKRHEYSYADGPDEKGRLKYQLNPVRIVFINESTLSLTHETGDPDDPGYGFYYYSCLDKTNWSVINQLTDMEPNSYNKKWYYLADLYSYTKKGS